MLDNFEIQFDLIDGKDIWETVKKDSSDSMGFYITGHIQNLKIKQSRTCIKICGSMGKFLNGENITHLDRKDIETGLNKLQDLIAVDLAKAIVRKFEFGDVFVMNESIEKYLKLFDYDKKRIKHEYGKASLETVDYHTETGQYGFIAYDKNAEMKNNDSIPDWYRNRNLLRMELRFDNPKQTFKKIIRPYYLADGIFYRELVNKFYNFYMGIQKTGRNIFIDTSKNKTYAGLKDVFAAAFKQLYPKEYSEAIQRAGLNKRGLEDLRKWEKQISTVAEFSCRNELISELDGKVKERCAGYL